MFSRKTASTRGLTQVIQRTTLQRAVAGDKGIFETMTPERAQQMGIVHIPTQAEIRQYTADQLYELAYGGSVDYFSNREFDEQRRNEREYLVGYTTNSNVIESIYTCPKCEYKRVRVDQAQFRGGDESQTSRFRCVRCNTPWSNSG